MWRNVKNQYPDANATHKAASVLVKKRVTFRGGPFISHHESCRLALPETPVGMCVDSSLTPKRLLESESKALDSAPPKKQKQESNSPAMASSSIAAERGAEPPVE
jgi:hypothetical protein